MVWRSVPIPLAGVDDPCVVHQFIRIYGRRPTAQELDHCRQESTLSLPARQTAVAVGSVVRVTGLVRRGLARALVRL